LRLHRVCDFAHEAVVELVREAAEIETAKMSYVLTHLGTSDGWATAVASKVMKMIHR
jgi:hypothetical protein